MNDDLIDVSPQEVKTRASFIKTILYIGIGFLCLIWSMGAAVNWSDAWTYAIVSLWPGFLLVWFVRWLGTVLVGLALVGAVLGGLALIYLGGSWLYQRITR